jgi:hypothetical protein
MMPMRFGTRSVCVLFAACMVAGVGAGGARAQSESAESVSGSLSVGAEDAAGSADASRNAPNEDPSEQADDAALPWALLHRGYNTLDGSTGGLFLEDPGMAAPGSVRLQLGLGTFSSEDVLFEGDEVERTEHRLTASFTALEFMELFAMLHSRGVVSDLPLARALHTLGDLAFGIKLGTHVSQVLRLGGSLRFVVRNDIGPQDALLDSTSIGLRGALALDFQRADSPIPLILRANVDYLFDNSARAVKDIEDGRYDSLGDDALARGNEVRHLISRVERYGLGVNRVDMLTLGIGAELPIELGRDTYLHPLLEHRTGLPINRSGYDCAFFSGDEDRGTTEQEADDTCLDDAGFSSFPMSLALGVRFVPPVRGLSMALAVDFGLSGTSTFVREIAPTTPFMLWLALGYDYDAQPPPPPPAPPPPPPPPPASGRIEGIVVDLANNVPITSAIVKLPSSEHTPLATNVAGRFVSYELPPGQYLLELAHPDYHPGTCNALISTAGGTVQAQCGMTALPVGGSVVATARDAYGTPVAGVRVSLEGPAQASAHTDADGQARLSDVLPGEQRLRFTSDSHLVRIAQVAVQARAEARLEVALVSRPSKPALSVRGDSIVARTLKFEPGSTQLGSEGSRVVAELADLLLRKPELGRLVIAAEGAEGLGSSRALTLKQGLVDLGVPEHTLEASSEPASRVTLTLQP